MFPQLGHIKSLHVKSWSVHYIKLLHNFRRFGMYSAWVIWTTWLILLWCFWSLWCFWQPGSQYTYYRLLLWQMPSISLAAFLLLCCIRRRKSCGLKDMRVNDDGRIVIFGWNYPVYILKEDKRWTTESLLF